jgi:hypothetical protein
VASPRVRASAILEARQRANLTQLELATLAEEASTQGRRPRLKQESAAERSRRLCCVELVRVVLGSAGGRSLRSDAEREFLECDADPVSWRLVGNDLVVAAS